jgi:hypothetical protein
MGRTGYPLFPNWMRKRDLADLRQCWESRCVLDGRIGTYESRGGMSDQRSWRRSSQETIRIRKTPRENV